MMELIGILVFILGTAAVIILSVSFIRWVFRIDKIVELLQQKPDKPSNLKPPEKGD